MNTAVAAVVDSMGERAKRLPPAPRMQLGPYTILPAVDEDWQPIEGMWVLPGCQVVSTVELTALAQARGLSLYQLA